MANVANLPPMTTSEIVYNGAFTPTTPPVKLDIKGNDAYRVVNGLFRHVWGLLITIGFTPTFGTNASALAKEKEWGLLANLRSKMATLDDAIVDNLTGEELVLLAQEALRTLSPDAVEDYFPLTDLATSANGVAQHLVLIVPYAPRFANQDLPDEQRFAGAAPLYEFNNGEHVFTPFSSLTLQGSSGTVVTAASQTLKVEPLYVDQPFLLSYEPYYYKGQDVSGSKPKILDTTARKRVVAVLAKSSTPGADMVLPSAYSVNFENKDYVSNRVPAAEIRDGNIMRQGAEAWQITADDYPVALPIIVPSGKKLSQCPVIDGPITLSNVFSGQANAGRVISLHGESLDEATMAKVLTNGGGAGGVPDSVAAAAAKAIAAGRTRSNTALVTQTVYTESNWGE